MLVFIYSFINALNYRDVYIALFSDHGHGTVRMYNSRIALASSKSNFGYLGSIAKTGYHILKFDVFIRQKWTGEGRSKNMPKNWKSFMDGPF